MFEFKHIKPFDRSYADNPGPMVSIVFTLQEGWKFKWQRTTAIFALSGGVCHARYAARWSVFADLQEMGWK